MEVCHEFPKRLITKRCLSSPRSRWAGANTCETPTVPVMPDLRLKPAALMPDDFSASPTVVEVKVPVASPQLRPVGVGNNVPAVPIGCGGNRRGKCRRNDVSRRPMVS